MSERRQLPQLPPGTRLRRHAALVPLSRDHHHALVQALRLREGAAGSDSAASDVSRGFLDHWEREMAGHFDDEELVLVPRVREVDAEAVARVLAEHDELRGLVARLRQALASRGELHRWLREIGELVRDHVRYEERAWFEHVQQRLSAAELEEIGRQLEARRLGRGAAPACPR